MIDNNICLSKDLQFKVKLFTDLKKKGCLNLYITRGKMKPPP